MTTTFLTKTLARAGVLALTASALLVGAAAGQTARAGSLRSDARVSGGRLVGTWEFQVTFRNCDDGTPLGPPFTSFHTYLPGGSAIEQGATPGPPPATSRSIGQGVWERAAGGRFQAQFTFYSFDATGQLLVRVAIDEDLEFTGGDTVDGAGVGRVFTPAGQQVATNCFTSPGRRVKLSN
jgi:hypothetical protein